MIDHIGISVSDIQKSTQFYEAALEPLGYAKAMDYGEAVELRQGLLARFLDREQRHAWHGRTSRFSSQDRADRRQLSTRRRSPPAARTTARPVLRAQYHDNYFGAFILDPDGNNLEAVCHDPE